MELCSYSKRFNGHNTFICLKYYKSNLYKMLIEKDKSSLVIIDVQEKLVSVMPKPPTFINNIIKLQKAANIFKIPITISEQYPKGLGKTIDKIKAQKYKNIIEKTNFSITAEGFFYEAEHIVMCGIEAHVCVLQTAIDIVENDKKKKVYIVQDAISSRYQNDYLLALSRMDKYHNIEIVSCEMVIFEWLRKSRTEEFKTISQIIK